jgi:hypothetical protein
MPTRKYLRKPRHFVGRIPQPGRIAAHDLEALYDFDFSDRRPRRLAPRKPGRAFRSGDGDN